LRRFRRKACDKRTIGLLQRRLIQIEQIEFIGKESNTLEEVESGLIHSAQDVCTENQDPRRDELETRILPASKKVALPHLVKESGKSRRMLKDLRAGEADRIRKTRSCSPGNQERNPAVTLLQPHTLEEQ